MYCREAIPLQAYQQRWHLELFLRVLMKITIYHEFAFPKFNGWVNLYNIHCSGQFWFRPYDLCLSPLSKVSFWLLSVYWPASVHNEASPVCSVGTFLILIVGQYIICYITVSMRVVLPLLWKFGLKLTIPFVVAEGPFFAVACGY